MVRAPSTLLLGAMAAMLLVSSAIAAKRPFTVADSIERTELTEPDLQTAFIGGIRFNWSPDGRFIVEGLPVGGGRETLTVGYVPGPLPPGADPRPFAAAVRVEATPGGRVVIPRAWL